MRDSDEKKMIMGEKLHRAFTCGLVQILLAGCLIRLDRPCSHASNFPWMSAAYVFLYARKEPRKLVLHYAASFLDLVSREFWA